MTPRYLIGWQQKAVPTARGVAWALLAGAAAVAYYLLSVLLGTSFFVANSGPVLAPDLFWSLLGFFMLETVFLFWHRTLPATTFLAVVAATLTAVWVFPQHSFTVGMTLLFAMYNMVSRVRPAVWGWLLPLVFVAEVVVQLGAGMRYGTPFDLYSVFVITLQTIPDFLAPLLAGLLVSSQQRRAELAAESARLAVEREQLARRYADTMQRERDAQVSAVLTGERNRMAREIHDVASNLTTSALMRTQAAILIQDSEPDTLRRLLDAIKVDAELALRSLRDAIGALRADDADFETPRQAALPDFLEALRETDPGLEMEITGDLEQLPASTSLACQRIVQESLANARKYAPGSTVRVTLNRDKTGLSVEVRNSAPTLDAPGSPSLNGGFGVLGMRERATMLGGWLENGADGEGGWFTRAVIPLESRVSV